MGWQVLGIYLTGDQWGGGCWEYTSRVGCVWEQDALDVVLAAGKCKIMTMLPSSSNLFVDSMLWPAWLKATLSEPMFVHFTAGALIQKCVNASMRQCVNVCVNASMRA
jgi:hypothetical protein